MQSVFTSQQRTGSRQNSFMLLSSHRNLQIARVAFEHQADSEEIVPTELFCEKSKTI